MIGTSTQKVNGSLRKVAGSVGVSKDERRASLGGHRTIEKMERIGHHSRIEHIVCGEWSTPEIHSLGIHMTVIANRCRHMGHRFRSCSVHVHVTTCHQCKFSSSEHPVRRHKFVCRSSPRCSGCMLAITAGFSGRNQYRVRQTTGNGHGTFNDSRDAKR